MSDATQLCLCVLPFSFEGVARWLHTHTFDLHLYLTCAHAHNHAHAHAHAHRVVVMAIVSSTQHWIQLEHSAYLIGDTPLAEIVRVTAYWMSTLSTVILHAWMGCKCGWE